MWKLTFETKNRSWGNIELCWVVLIDTCHAFQTCLSSSMHMNSFWYLILSSCWRELCWLLLIAFTLRLCLISKRRRSSAAFKKRNFRVSFHQAFLFPVLFFDHLQGFSFDFLSASWLGSMSHIDVLIASLTSVWKIYLNWSLFLNE